MTTEEFGSGRGGVVSGHVPCTNPENGHFRRRPELAQTSPVISLETPTKNWLRWEVDKASTRERLLAFKESVRRLNLQARFTMKPKERGAHRRPKQNNSPETHRNGPIRPRPDQAQKSPVIGLETPTIVRT